MKTCFGFPTRSDTNWALQLQKVVKGLKFWIYEVEGLYYLCSETKWLISCAVNAQLICAFAFAYAKRRFSHDAARFYSHSTPTSG